jgi:hypothetical protein
MEAKFLFGADPEKTQEIEDENPETKKKREFGMNNNDVATEKGRKGMPSSLAEKGGDGSSKISGCEVKVGNGRGGGMRHPLIVVGRDTWNEREETQEAKHFHKMKTG